MIILMAMLISRLFRFIIFQNLPCLIFCLATIALSFNSLRGQESSLHRYEFSEFKMGTVFRLVFYASSESQANQLSRLAFEKIDRLNDIFSDYDERSEVSRLSFHAGSGKKIRVSNELWDVLSLSKTISAQSNGSFDITIGPASKLWRRAIRRNTFPEQKAIEQAQSLVNWKWLILDAEIQSAELVKDGMRLDLGGIAKGFTVDQVFELFESHGLTRVLIDGGGDIYVGDPPPGKEPAQ